MALEKIVKELAVACKIDPKAEKMLIDENNPGRRGCCIALANGGPGRDEDHQRDYRGRRHGAEQERSASGCNEVLEEMPRGLRVRASLKRGSTGSSNTECRQTAHPALGRPGNPGTRCEGDLEGLGRPAPFHVHGLPAPDALPAGKTVEGVQHGSKDDRVHGRAPDTNARNGGLANGYGGLNPTWAAAGKYLDYRRPDREELRPVGTAPGLLVHACLRVNPGP